ncbi:PRC-barrel domain-containing protein, partial [Pseudomonas sp. JAI120]|uniref:PRC-barrel domain-containing protein n=1 Tax=Pseudomonas sp. JAI120 TaxID=2723063 RepID=UPI0030EE0D03
MSDSPEPSTADATLSLSSLLKHAVIDGDGRTLGKLSDVVTRLRDNDYPLLTGLVISLGSAGYFVPMSDVTSIDPEAVRLLTAKVDLRPFQRRDGELLLKENILG